MLKRILFTVFFVFLTFIGFAGPVKADNTVPIYFFWSEGCPHCKNEKPFLEELSEKYTSVELNSFEISKSSKNRKLLIEIGEILQKDVSGVPFTVIGDQVFTGYTESITSKQIEDRVKYCLNNSCPDSVVGVIGEVISEVTPTPKSDEAGQTGSIIDKVRVPLFGEIDLKNLSLPLVTIVLGALDGFNPCAMWTLLFLISLLLGVEDKKRRWILGSAFIFASAFVYFLFMAAWLNLLLFIGFVIWVRILVALVALGGGIYNIREYYTNKEGACKVTGGEKRKAVFEKLKEVTMQKTFILALLGIILLAFAVNLVELICSAGLPVIFTQILTLSNLSQGQYYAYMLLYIFIFMLDDLFIFFTAMITLEMTGISTKYSRYSHLVGGMLMIIIGLLLLFKPELLMFG